MLLTLLLLTQIRSAFPPVDHPGAGGMLAPRLRQACAVTGPTDRRSLLKREGDLSNRVGRNGESSDNWATLGCLRGLLYLDGALAYDGALMVSGDSWDRGAEHAFRQALQENPADARAAAGLSLLAMNDAEPRPLKEIAAAIITATERRVAAPAVLSACAELAYRIGNSGASRTCAQRALAAGVDSTWNLLRLTRLAFRDADTVNGNRLFDLAAQSAHDSLARLEIDWQLQWFLSPAERKDWAGLPDSARGRWVLDRLASRDVRDGQPAGARLAEHFNRLDYVESHYRMRVPRVLREKARTAPASVVRTASGTDTTIFREYNRWQVDFDDAGVVWMRWGKPSKVAIDTVDSFNMLAREGWRYDIDGKSLLLVFQGEDFSGSSGATTLQAGIVGEFLCGLDAYRCALAMKGKTGLLTPEGRVRVVDFDRENILAATTSDDNSVRTDKTIEVISRLHRLWDLISGAPVALLTYAVKTSDLSIQQSGEKRTTLIDFDFRRWDATEDRWQDTVFSRHLTLPSTGPGVRRLTGFIVTPSSPSVSSWSLVATQSESRRGRAWDVTTGPLDHGPLVLSDLVLGQEGQGLVWANHNAEVLLAPLNAVDRKEPVSLFYQIRSDQARQGVRTTVALYRIQDGVARDTAALQVGFDQAVRAGVNEVAPTLDVSRLDKGSYRLEVRLTDDKGAVISRRTAQLNLD